MKISSSESLSARRLEPTAIDAPRPPAPHAVPSSERSSFREVVSRLGREIDRGERTVQGALGGTSSSDPAALIALQAGIYRYTEAVDLAGKLVDRAATGVKTVLQGQ